MSTSTTSCAHPLDGPRSNKRYSVVILERVLTLGVDDRGSLSQPASQKPSQTKDLLPETLSRDLCGVHSRFETTPITISTLPP